MVAPIRDAATVPLEAPALIAGAGTALWLGLDGAVLNLSLPDAALRARHGPPPILCHAPLAAKRLGVTRFAALDVLELHAFVRPTRACVPTVRGLAAALGLERPRDHAAEVQALPAIAQALLSELASLEERDEAALIAQRMAAAGWSWGAHAVAALGRTGAPAGTDAARPELAGFAVWRKLPSWSEHAPEPPPGSQPVLPAEARRRLAELLARDWVGRWDSPEAGAPVEPRPQQADYASAVTAAFTPRERRGVPRFVLAEAGTGVGKTLGYIAPASLWAEKNGGPVWISTYTRNLQHQIDGELDRLHPDPLAKSRRVVIRKGRENYLCLLNMDEAVTGARLDGREVIALGLIARWAAETRDGDMIGGDFPSWLADLVGWSRTLDLRDHRGECVYSACPHYHKCFIEGGIRRARRAEIVIANHALVMAQAALGGLDDGTVPQRYVFDEGHHVFDAADGAFSAYLSGAEMAEFRRWVLGREDRRRSRARGLKRRTGDLALGDAEAERAIEEAERGARALPGEGWPSRVAGAEPRGPAERFLALVRETVYARAPEPLGPYGLECEPRPPAAGLLDAAAALEQALDRLGGPLVRLAARLEARLDDAAAALDSPTRLRLEAIARSLRRRGEIRIPAWRLMLRSLAGDPAPEFVDWLSVDRFEGRELDLGLNRHWVDPTIPFVAEVAEKAHGVLVTSATLRDSTGEVERDWAAAEALTGAHHLAEPAVRASMPSPFDYARQTVVLVVRDVRRDDLDQVAAAYRELFIAAGGGGLGLFTAIARLRAVHARIAEALEAAGLTLLAQHVDPLDTTTLVNIFRAEEDVCLLGTDAVRDGVDVPGRALRLIVYDRVPWPRPDILHKARKAYFGPVGYDDMLTRLRLKQAYGRLIRRADDRGAFVMLDAALPSRLATAFPEGVAVERVGLAEAVARVGAFLAPA